MKRESSVFISKFSDIHPSLLLFLNNLRYISIVDNTNGIIRTIARRDIGEHSVEIFNDIGFFNSYSTNTNPYLRHYKVDVSEEKA